MVQLHSTVSNPKATNICYQLLSNSSTLMVLQLCKGAWAFIGRNIWSVSYIAKVTKTKHFSNLLESLNTANTLSKSLKTPTSRTSTNVDCICIHRSVIPDRRQEFTYVTLEITHLSLIISYNTSYILGEHCDI